MKRLYLVALWSLFLCACQNETPSSETMGTLETEALYPMSAKVETLTRSVDAGLIVEVWKDGALYTDGTRTFRFEAGQFPRTMQLPAGSYVVKAFNADYEQNASLTDADKGAPLFFKEQPVTVEENKVCRMTLAVPMVNMGVSLVLPQGFAEHFTHYEFAVTQQSGGSTRTVTLLDKETAYFAKAAFSCSLKVTNADGEAYEMLLAHDTDVQSGTVYQVTYSYQTESTRFR